MLGGTMNRTIAYAGWPVGVALVLAGAGAGLPVPLLAALGLGLGAAYALVLRRLAAAARRDPAAVVLAAAGVGLFALVGVVGPPTAAKPGLMLLNAVVLLAVAVALLWATVSLALRLRSGPTGPTGPSGAAVLAVAALGVGSVGYLLNLLARWAVVVSGAAPAQAGVEERAWTAASYLRGLEGEPTYVTYLLVWFDLIQVAYLVLSYVSAAALAVALGRAGLLAPRPAKAIARAGVALATLVVAGAAVAPVDGPVGTVGAWTAFVLTIPFMSTLLPHLVGVGLLRPAAVADAPSSGRGSGVDPQPVRAALAFDVR
jgi:hypothetical protein